MPELSPFGARVIGEAAAKEQEHLRKTAGHIFGPRVVEPSAPAGSAPVMPPAPSMPPAPTMPPAPAVAAPVTVAGLAGVNFASEAAAAIAQEHGLEALQFAGYKPSGPRGFSANDVRAIVAANRPKNEVPVAAASIADITSALDANPSVVPELLEAELARVEGPRLAALRKLREVEGLRPREVGGPRPEVLDSIDAALSRGSAEA